VYCQLFLCSVIPSLAAPLNALCFRRVLHQSVTAHLKRLYPLTQYKITHTYTGAASAKRSAAAMIQNLEASLKRGLDLLSVFGR
jgi:hypothetical protein